MSKFILSAFADEAASDIVGQKEALQRNNIHFIEIRNVDGINITDHDTMRIKQIASVLKENGISVSAIGSPIGKISVHESFAPHLERFQKALEAAHILGTSRIRLFSFFLPKDQTAVECRKEVFSRMEALLYLAEGEGITCCHENEKGIYGSTKNNCLDLLTTFKGRLNGIFDPANFVQCGEEPSANIDELLPYTDYMHIKDALFSDGSVVPAGMGDAGIPELLKKFSDVKGERYLTLEPHLAVFDGFGNLADRNHKTKFAYASQAEAFDTAVSALKKILDRGGYQYE